MFDPAQASFDQVLATSRPASVEAVELTAAVVAAARREYQQAAARLTAIGDLYALRFAERDEICDQWAVDTESAVAVEIAAALTIGHESAKRQVSLARGLRERLPLVARVFRAGELSTSVVETLLNRTALITDPGILTEVDAKLAGAAATLMRLSYGQLCGHVDRIIARGDADAVRRRKRAAEDREIWFADGLDGMSSFGGTMPITDADAVEQRLEALADTVCPGDPRTTKQRRVDAVAAMACGAERLQCRCDNADCPNRDAIATPFVIHAFTGPDSDSDGGDPVVSLVRNGGIVAPEQAAQIAEGAATRPLTHPSDAAPEPRYTPSKGLSDFVRCRDLACRFPGCDVPAWDCDLDHTIPYSEGGPTQASNLKCLCRLHHLVKTFWGWRDEQWPDGTVTWVSPAGDTYYTTPGSAIVCPDLCAPTAPVVRRETIAKDRGDRGAMMPTRKRTRAQNRAARIAAERDANREHRTARQRALDALYHPPPPTPDDQPPPF